MTDENYKAASKREESDAGINSSEREQARTHRVQMMMLDIDGVLTRYEATTADVLAAAQQMAVSAVGDLVNKGSDPEALHRAADAIAEQKLTDLTPLRPQTNRLISQMAPKITTSPKASDMTPDQPMSHHVATNQPTTISPLTHVGISSPLPDDANRPFALRGCHIQ